MASLTRWTWVWVNSGSWWWTGRPGVLWFMGSQGVGYDWMTELNWTDSPCGCKESDMTEWFYFHFILGLVQSRQILYLLSHWKSRINNASIFRKIKLSIGLCFFEALKALGKNSFLFFPISEATHILWLVALHHSDSVSIIEKISLNDFKVSFNDFKVSFSAFLSCLFLSLIIQENLLIFNDICIR